jgi:anthranilate phosphoribosyltransferase
MNFDFDSLLSGRATNPEIIAVLRDLAALPPAAAPLVALVKSLRTHALPFPPQPQAMDVCGTGGDGLDTPNISTAVAVVLAACGQQIVKHGNRAVTGRSGSADVLEAFGITIAIPQDQAVKALQATGLCFLYARHYHPALGHVAAARREFGQRSLFNLAGPLVNPALPKTQLLGVFAKEWLHPVAEALKDLGSQTALVVHSRDGMDEISTAAKTDAVLLENGVISELVIDPALLGIAPPDPMALKGGDAAQNAKLLQALFTGQAGALQDIVALNAAAALWLRGTASTLAAGLTQARVALSSGQAQAVLQHYAAICTNQPHANK